jgi:phosphate/sulfate permease
MKEKQNLKAPDELKPRGIHEWIDYYQKNKPQTNALAAGVMTILYGGQHLGWGIFNNHLEAQPWAGGYEDEGTVFWIIISWFIAAIVGFGLAEIVAPRITKMTIYVSSLHSPRAHCI